MNILIAGASGFIGNELVSVLALQHNITVLGRNKARLQRQFANVNSLDWKELAQTDARFYDVIINLCGYNISAKRWNARIKQLIIDSRVQTSTDLINWAIKYNATPHIYCANAVGIYGMQESGDTQIFDEDTPIDFDHPRDFLSEVGIKWQKCLDSALDFGMKLTITRFGVALKRGQGMLKKLAPSFYLGLGSIIGDGKQVISWVHIDDIVGAYLFLLERPELTGAFNLTSPNPVTQAQFARALAKAMHRPLLWRTPAFVIRRLFGEMGDSLLQVAV